jgi:hypothetical protein
MRSYYNITSRIKDWLEQNNIIKTVTLGDISEVDLNKQTIFPLAHQIVNNAILSERTITFDISILFIDVVDYPTKSAKDGTEAFYRSDNLQDVHNTMLAVANELAQQFFRGALFDENYIVASEVSCEPFQDRFENDLAGWSLNLSIEVPNNTTGVC